MLVRQLLPHGDVQDVTSGGMSTVMVRPPDGPMYTSTTSQPAPVVEEQRDAAPGCRLCLAVQSVPCRETGVFVAMQSVPTWRATAGVRTMKLCTPLLWPKVSVKRSRIFINFRIKGFIQLIFFQ